MDIAFQPKIISGARGHRDAITGAIHFFHPCDGGAGGNHIGGFNFRISRGEGDFLRALRFSPNEPDIPDIGIHRIGQITGPREGHVLHRHAKRIRNGARHARRYPGGVTIFRAAGDQQEIPHIDAGAQNARWRQFRLDLIHHDFFPLQYKTSATRRGGRTRAAIDMPATAAIKH